MDQVLEVVRTHLGMDVAFVGQIADGRRTFTNVAAADTDPPVRVGDSHLLEETYCTRIVTGEMGVLTDDALLDPRLRDLAVTAELDIRAYAGVPIRLSDKQVFGTLCAYSRHAKPMDPEDVYALQLAAGLIANRLEELAESRAEGGAASEVASEPRGQIHMLFQPIILLRTGEICGYEALARFDQRPVRGPDDWFALAARVGLDRMLQHQVAGSALAVLSEIPSNRYMTLNLNDAAVVDPLVQQLLDVGDAGRLVVELTEHDLPSDDPALIAAVAALRSRGSRLALDDIGTGYSGLARVLDLGPDMLKLDRKLVTDVATNPRKQAMVHAFTTYARAVDAVVVAEGIETAADADALRILGVHMGQGFFLGVPSDRPWDELFPA